MRKLMMICSLLLCSTVFLAQAPPPPPVGHGPKGPKGPKKSPEQIAKDQTDTLDKVVGLSADQRTKVYNAAFTRATKMHEIREKYRATKDRKAAQAEMKPIRARFVLDVNDALTPAQRDKWKIHRLERKIDQIKRKQGDVKKDAPPPKLEDDDDGLPEPK